MKKFRAINTSIKVLGLAAVVSMGSCLKNGQYYDDFAAVGASVELPLASANSNGVIPLAYNATVTTAVIPVYINLASPNLLSAAVTATLGLDTAFLRQYNNANGSAYVLLPDSVYTVSGWNRSIPAGKRLDSMVVTVNFAKMDLSQPYILPITIKTSSQPIEQWNHLMLNPSVKNKFDGKYSMDIQTIGWGAYSIADGPTYTWPSNVSLETTGALSVSLYTSEVGDLQPAFTSAPALTGFGATKCQFTFDASNKLVSVKNLVADDGRGRTFYLNPAVTTSRYDPATKTVYASYKMTQNGRPDQTINDTLVYKGPR
jgi:hypothetical protein